MKARIPFRQWRMTQGFSQNLNTYYKEDGLGGHTGWDLVAMPIGSTYDETMYCAIDDSYVFSIINKDNPDLMRYRAVYTLAEIDGQWFEISYGHCDQIFAEEGQTLMRGERIAKQGNTGDVATGGKKVTREMKANGSQLGEHLHWQFKLVMPTIEKKKTGTYLKNSNGYVKYKGLYWEVVEPKNGFKGCVNPAPFVEMVSAYGVAQKIQDFIAPPEKKITKTLRYGSTGEQVKILQEKLGIKADGIFGVRTMMSVKDFQAKKKLTVDGIVGEKTRAML